MSAPTFVGMKPMLSFTSHVAPRAGERQRRRRRKVKTPVNPRVRSVDLSGIVAQENRESRYSVKWVSPQFTGPSLSHSSLHATSSTTASNSRPSLPHSHAPRPRKQTKCVATTKPREIKVLFPPRSKPQRVRVRPMDATQREWHRAKGSSSHRTPLVEIDDNSFETPTPFDTGRNVVAVNEKTQTQVGSLAVGHVASHINGQGIEKCDQEEGRPNPKLQPQNMSCRHSIPPENVQTVESCKEREGENSRTWKGGGQISPGPTDIQNLSALMESTCINASPHTPQPGEAHVETLLAGDHEGWPNHVQNQPNMFDVTTFRPPTSSTPLGCKRVQYLNKEMGGSKRKENSGNVGRYNAKTCVSPTQPPVQLSLSGKTLDCKETRRYMQCSQQNDPVEHSSTVPAQDGSSSHSTFFSVPTPVLSMDETGFSNASILAPETPPEDWDTCRHFGTGFRPRRVGSHSRDIVSVQDSFM